MAAARILIVDDEPFNVDLLEQELELLGYETDSASDGREALERVAASAPDLVLLDVMMPVMDGFAVCRELKGKSDTRLIPVIIMTALDAVEDRIKGIEAGADDFLTKPVDDRELKARIQTALKQKRAVEEAIGALRSARDHFAKFVPEAVKRIVAANPEAPELAKREQDVSVLFVDIAGYGRLSETLASDVLNELMERYFSAFMDRIHGVGGDISGTAGDGLMAIFSDPEPRRHAATAAETALALLAETERLNAANSVQPLAVHMGLNSGVALVGSTRFEGQRGTRWTFTADGAVTNLASRLASIAEAGQVLLGPETSRRLTDGFDLRPIGTRTLKNIAEPVEVYRLAAAEAAA